MYVCIGREALGRRYTGTGGMSHCTLLAFHASGTQQLGDVIKRMITCALCCVCSGRPAGVAVT